MDAAYFDELIEIEADTIKASQKWSKLLFAIGIPILLIGVVAWTLAALKIKIVDAALAPSLVSMFGLITSAGSLLPYKEIAPRRHKIAKFKQLKRECEKIAGLPPEEAERRLKALNDCLSAF